jgi:hypothetical protein
MCCLAQSTTGRIARAASALRAVSAAHHRSSVHFSPRGEEVRLADAAAVCPYTRGTRLCDRIDHQRWSTFLLVPEPVEYVDWPPLLLSMRRVVRWLRRAEEAERSEYLLSSSARDLNERIRSDLEEAGIDLSHRHRLVAASAIDDLTVAMNLVFDRLDVA